VQALRRMYVLSRNVLVDGSSHVAPDEQTSCDWKGPLDGTSSHWILQHALGGTLSGVAQRALSGTLNECLPRALSGLMDEPN
jgi:hypothetical protein